MDWHEPQQSGYRLRATGMAGEVGHRGSRLGLDDQRGTINLKNYTLRGVGTNVEVWVANNLNFPNTSMLNPLTQDPTDFFTYNDCRNDGIRNVISNWGGFPVGSADQFIQNPMPTESDPYFEPPIFLAHATGDSSASRLSSGDSPVASTRKSTSGPSAGRAQAATTTSEADSSDFRIMRWSSW